MAKYLVLVVFSVGVMAAVSAAQSQQGNTAPRHPPDFPNMRATNSAESLGDVVMIEIAADKRVRVQGIKGYESWTPGPEAIKKALSHYLELQKPKAFESAIPARVALRFDPLLDMTTVFDYVRVARNGASELSIELSDDRSLMIPPEPDDRFEMDVKPNPLFLLAAFDEKGSVTLNNEAYGSTKNPQVLQSKLKELFKERERNGVFRENANEIEKSLFIRVPESVRFGDVSSFATAIADVGGDRLWLAIEKIGILEDPPAQFDLATPLPMPNLKRKPKRKPGK